MNKNVRVDEQGREKININREINMTVYKNSFGLNIHHEVVYFPNMSMNRVSCESNLFKVLPDMLKAVYEAGRENKRLEIEAFYYKFMKTIKE